MYQKYSKELNDLISIGPIVVYTCEAFGEFSATSITPNITQQLGYEPDEFLKTPSFWASNIHPDDRDEVFENLKTLFEEGKHSHEYRFLHKDGTYKWMHDDLLLMHETNGDPKSIVGYWTDVTERKKAEEAIKFMSTHDMLTSLPNRILLMDRLDNSLARAHRDKEKFAVLFVDLDGFKSINDALGHESGDEVLKLVAERLTLCLRETDTVARYGGDEFIILLVDCISENDISIKVQELIDKVSERIKLGNDEVLVGVSIGISIYPDHAETSVQLLSLADKAMYKAKSDKTTHFHFTAS